MTDIDSAIDAQQAKLKAFAGDARSYLDALEREIAARLQAITAGLTGQGDSGGMSSAEGAGNGSAYGAALQSGLDGSVGSLLHGRTDAAHLLRSPIDAVGRLLGDSLAGSLGFGSEGGMRLSESQSAMELSAAAGGARRNL